MLHGSYAAGIALKGVDGLIEICAGALLLLTAKSTLVHVVAALAQSDLAQNPHGFLATHALTMAAGLSLNTQHFASAYLLCHGATKTGLVAGLLCGWHHAYPAALALLSAFIGYQGYRLARYPSWVLGVFTAIDVAIALLIAHEWRRIGRTAQMTRARP